MERLLLGKNKILSLGLLLNDLKSIILKSPDFVSFELTSKHMQYICEMTESNIVDRIYDKLFSNIKIFVSEEDEEFTENCLKLLEVEQWGFCPDLLTLDFSESIQELMKINGKTTPWEKQDTITGFVGVFEKECKAHLVRNNPLKAETWELSADEFIPLLMYFLCIHKPQDLIANLTFIKELSISPDSSGSRTYQFTNIYAAFHSIKHLVEEHREREKVPTEEEEEEELPPPPTIVLTATSTYGAFGPPSKRNLD